uniref:Uncharacterized protein n=1 Tax=viral metagenome TaxID=1070528 RepID=A0A6M3JSK1_9ZZZZ
MSGNNRHLRGNTQQIRGAVHGNTVVEPGDLVCINSVSGFFGNLSANIVTATDYLDNYLYPLSSAVSNAVLSSAYMHHIATTFMGVALTGSASGTTNEVVVAVDGIFRYPLLHNSAVTLGAKVSAVSTTAGTGSSNQAVMNNATLNDKGTTAYLGVIVKTESGASFVDFQLITATSGGSIA